MSTAQSLPEPLAQGDLGRTPFAHVLLHVQRRGLRGSLVIWDPDAADGRPKQDRILFESGAPVAGRLRERASRLDRGMLPLFARRRGPYAFYEGVDLTGEGALRSEPVEVLPLIAASLRGSSRDDVVAQVVRAFGDAKLRIVRGLSLDALGLLPEEQACVELLRAEPASAAALARLSPLDARRVQRLVYLLALVKGVEPWEEDGSAARPAERSPPRPAPRSAEAARSAPEPEPEASSRQSGSRARPPRGPEPPPPVPDGLSDEHRARWEEIAARADAIERENYFEMLGVPRDAAADTVRKAYLGLVKHWHPDRLPAELRELRPHVERIFRYLTRANETLIDDAERGKYLATVQDGGGTPEAERQLGRIVQAAMEFRKVEVLMRRREWDEALALLDEILALNDEEADYHATRGWVLFQKRGGDEGAQLEALAAIDRALSLTQDHDKAHYYKGMILKRAGQAGEALAHFQKAAELNPKNIDAVREVRIAEMRGSSGGKKSGKKSGDGAKDSLLGKLFGGKKK